MEKFRLFDVLTKDVSKGGDNNRLFCSYVSSKIINNESNACICFPIGSIDGNIIEKDLATMPHLIVAGYDGKSTKILDSIICSLMLNYSPGLLVMIIIGNESSKLSRYGAIPHLLTDGIVSSCNETQDLMKYLNDEIDKRFVAIRDAVVCNLARYNASVKDSTLPRVVVIVEDMEKLLKQKPEFAETTDIISRVGRSVGIHLIAGTEKPLLLGQRVFANIASRVCFKVLTEKESVVSIGEKGAENLNGDEILYKEIFEDRSQKYDAIFPDEKNIDSIISLAKSCYKNSDILSGEK